MILGEVLAKLVNKLKQVIGFSLHIDSVPTSHVVISWFTLVQKV